MLSAMNFERNGRLAGTLFFSGFQVISIVHFIVYLVDVNDHSKFHYSNTSTVSVIAWPFLLMAVVILLRSWKVHFEIWAKIK